MVWLEFSCGCGQGQLFVGLRGIGRGLFGWNAPVSGTTGPPLTLTLTITLIEMLLWMVPLGHPNPNPNPDPNPKPNPNWNAPVDGTTGPSPTLEASTCGLNGCMGRISIHTTL